MPNNFSEEIEQLIKNSQVLPESYATDHTEWDESSKFMELPNRLFDRKISDLTIYEFTQLIRDIVRMELKEQISKINFTQYTPQYPFKPPTWDPPKPWEGPWCMYRTDNEENM